MPKNPHKCTLQAPILTENKFIDNKNLKTEDNPLDWTKNLSKAEKNSFLNELSSHYQRFKKVHQAKKPCSLPVTRPTSHHLPPPPASSSAIPASSINPKSSPQKLCVSPRVSSEIPPASSSIIPQTNPSIIMPGQVSSTNPLPISFAHQEMSIENAMDRDNFDEEVEKSAEKHFSKVDRLLEEIMKIGEMNKEEKSEIRRGKQKVKAKNFG
jgi:hypothetical protein